MNFNSYLLVSLKKAPAQAKAFLIQQLILQQQFLLVNKNFCIIFI